MDKIRVASVQLEHKNGDKEANLVKVRAFVEKAAGQKVQVVCFPECCISGYWGLRKWSKEQLLDLAEPIPDGPTAQEVLSLAKKHDMIVGAGFIEKTADGEMFNTYLVAMPDGEWHIHRKIHCFINQNVSSGNEYTVFDTPLGWKMGVLICYDNNIIENVRIIRIELQSPLKRGYGAIMVSAEQMITCHCPIAPSLVIIMLDRGVRKFQGLCHRKGGVFTPS